LIYQDKIYKEINNDNVRDKIMNRIITREECNSNKVYAFLKMLKSTMIANRHFEPILKEE